LINCQLTRVVIAHKGEEDDELAEDMEWYKKEVGEDPNPSDFVKPSKDEKKRKFNPLYKEKEKKKSKSTKQKKNEEESD
jgi:hypothetical protein